MEEDLKVNFIIGSLSALILKSIKSDRTHKEEESTHCFKKLTIVSRLDHNLNNADHLIL